MTNQSPAEALRQQILTEFKQVLKLAPADYTENCTNVVMELVTAYAATVEREAARNTAIEIRKAMPKGSLSELRVFRWIEANYDRLAALQGPLDKPQ